MQANIKNSANEIHAMKYFDTTDPIHLFFLFIKVGWGKKRPYGKKPYMHHCVFMVNVSYEQVLHCH